MMIESPGGVSLLTEFGVCRGYDLGPDEVDIECGSFMRISDDFLSGWIEWDYNDGKWYDSNGIPYWPKIMPYMRPYARRTAGTPLHMSFNTTTLEFNFEFEADLSIEAPTELFLPPQRYTTGVAITVSEGFFVSPVFGEDVIGLYHVVPSENEGQTRAKVLAFPL